MVVNCLFLGYQVSYEQGLMSLLQAALHAGGAGHTLFAQVVQLEVGDGSSSILPRQHELQVVKEAADAAV